MTPDLRANPPVARANPVEQTCDNRGAAPDRVNESEAYAQPPLLSLTIGRAAMMSHPRRPNKPITKDLADLLAPRILKRTKQVRRGRWLCWERTTAVNPATGYSSITRTVDGNKEYFFAHRVMYVHAKGEFPAELTIDHLCENRACCNPAHLRAVPHAENVLRSRTNPTAIRARRTHCPKGHELPPRSLTEASKRKCAECAEVGRTRRRRARAEQGIPPGHPKHGTSAGYQYWMGRCDLCKAWQRAYHLTRKASAA